MTPEILEYLLRVTVIWLVLLAYYFVAGRKAGFRFQRFFLLGGWLFGLLVPMLPSMAGEINLPVANLPTISLSGPVAIAVSTMEVAAASSWELTDLLPWLYLLGGLFFGARTLVQAWVTEQYLRSGQRSTFSGYPVVRHAGIESPFAARGYVFLPASITDADLEHTALIHETSHLRARHHYDKIFLTLGSILLWFHPLMWAYRRLLATVHEYEADAAVLQQVPARTYGLQLLHCSLGPARGLGLFSSPLKQRIEMITQQAPSPKFHFLPYLILPFLLTILIVSCSDIRDDLTLKEESLEDIPISQITLPSAVDEYPRLINSQYTSLPAEEALKRAIAAELNYPEEALKMGYEGKVRASVYIGEDGMVAEESSYTETSGDGYANSPTHIRVSSLKPAEFDPLPDNVRSSVLVHEVFRAIKALGQFQPTTTKGEKTPVMLELYITFKLGE